MRDVLAFRFDHAGDVVAAIIAGFSALFCDAAEPGVPILRMAKQWTDPAKDCGGTIWRYHETWRTEVLARSRVTWST